MSGAQFAQTQFCMDANVLRRYAQCLADNGLGRFFLLVGLAPIRSARSARWIRDKLPGSIVPDAVIERLERSSEPVREGRKICLELVDELSEIPGAAGVHIMAPGNDAGLAEVVAEAARIAKRKDAQAARPAWRRRELGSLAGAPAVIALHLSALQASQAISSLPAVGSIRRRGERSFRRPLRRPSSAPRASRIRLQIPGIATKVLAMVGYQTFGI